jgi:hypothetical protein
MSRRVTRNLLDAVVTAARKCGIVDLRCIQKVSEKPEVNAPGITFVTDNAKPLAQSL